MSIIEIEVRGTSTTGYADALKQAELTAHRECGASCDLDEISRFVNIDGAIREFGVTLKATVFKKTA